MIIFFELFWAFFKIGAFSFGGGYTMLPFIESEIVTNHHWITKAEFVDIIGISQMTPGPIAINSATFVGYKIGGFLGSLFSTIGVVTMSFILISIANKAINKIKHSKIWNSALLGMRPILIALIINAFLSLAKTSYIQNYNIDFKAVIISIITLGLLLSKKLHPILSIVIAAVLGIVVY